MGKIDTNTNTNTNANTSKNTMGKQTFAMNRQDSVLSGSRNEGVRITLPKGSYTIDGDGNLTIHSREAMSGREMGEMSAPLRSSLSYGEFMAKMGRSTERSSGGDGDLFGMDFSALGADPEKLVRECKGTVYGYARCSTVHQDYQRQIDALRRLGIREENIFKDKKSGKDFNREEFQKLMLVLQPGDCIVVVELDRFGRSMTEIKKQWFWITQQKQADIIVLDQPVLNTRLGTHGLSAFLADLILAVFSLMAEIERSLINKRMEAGIKRARLAGRKLGRKLMDIPLLFWKLKENFLGGQISQNMASQKLGVDPKTFRSWVERTGDILNAQEWEALKAGLEEQEKEERIRQARIKYGEMAEPSDAGATQEAEARKETVMVQEAEVRQKTVMEQRIEARKETIMAQEIEVRKETVMEQKMAVRKETVMEQDNRQFKRQKTLGEAKKKQSQTGKHARKTVGDKKMATNLAMRPSEIIVPGCGKN